ncbi:MAG: tRNA 2-thiocytidine biosynthesis protein TtcA [Clostridiales bacterium]|nr:tRNA 2-thiocytidine biosynthesis protein TtcA [Clostridiales bacterium]
MDHGITTSYRKTIWRYFVCAVKEYGLINPGDRVAVCVSGGKDSFLLAKCMQLLQKHGSIPFELFFLSMDPGFSIEKRTSLEETAKALCIPIHIFETDIFTSIEAAKNSPCHVCASMRRGHLYKQAQMLGCNKIALGHHYDDVIETTMLSILYGGEFKTMMPKLRSRNFDGMQLIRPLYLVREEQVKSFTARYHIPVMSCACRITQSEDGGKRKKVKELIKDLKKSNPNVESCIFSSAQKVSLGAVLGWRQRDEGPFTSFIDVYDNQTGTI